ncbi:cyclin-J [Amyelois transitella]|uniref:cyclin-J n=1 Tax=Amyelois transitella TaxID=680683 RepID=UPI00298FDBFC|nr:cyclin-J [Amyelois transitella]
MESLNMSALNLSSVRSHTSKEKATKDIPSEARVELGPMYEPDDYHCEYTEDIWKSLLEQDAEKPRIHLQSPQLEFRGALVQQLRDVTKKLQLNIATLHSAVAFLDRFMDAYRLRSDRLTHVALACLSLAAKSEEKFSQAPTLSALEMISDMELCGKTFRQLEWMVGQHMRWRLLSPTAVTFAALLAKYVVTDADLTTRHPKFVRRFKRDGAKLLDSYLDLTLSDVRLKAIESVDVGCACVACARAALGLAGWPGWLAALAGRRPADILPVAKLLHKMMEAMKSKDNPDNSNTDCPVCSSQQVTSTTTRNYLNETTDYTVLDLSNPEYCRLTGLERYMRVNRLLDPNVAVQPSTSVAVRRSVNNNDIEIERKRYRLSAQMSQVVL